MQGVIYVKNIGLEFQKSNFPKTFSVHCAMCIVIIHNFILMSVIFFQFLALNNLKLGINISNFLKIQG